MTDIAAGGGVITPYDGVQAPAFADAGVFGKMFKNERGSAALGAFKLDYPAGLLDSLQVFTIGFWFQSDGTANDRSILGNKDYNSGGNPASPSPSGLAPSCASTWRAADRASTSTA